MSHPIIEKPEIYATLVNNKGKTEKNKKVQEGKCIFPFKYKWKEHLSCFVTELGDICATVVNPKTNTLIKYGYCPKTRKSTTSSTKKSTEKRGTVKKAPTTIAPKKTKHKIKLKIVDKKSSLKTKSQSPVKMAKHSGKRRLNEEFIGIMEELYAIMTRQGEPFRAKAYRQAAEAIITYNDDISDPEQLKDVRHIGKTIMEKLKEYVKTGTLRILERERKNPLNLLTKVYGIGPKKAKEFIDKGITTIEDLKAHPDLLTKNMKLGVEYFDDIEARIPRDEIDAYQKTLTTIFNEVTPPGSTMEIVGSYRRGAKTSGDIDIVMTNDENNDKILDMFLDVLKKENIILEVLSKGKTKSMTIGRLPDKRPRRLDFMYTPPKEYAFATLYFTGSKAFNTVQRQRALQLGYTLNEHGFHKMVDGKKGSKIIGDFPNEEAIFNFLDMEYRTPQERIDGRSVKLLKKDLPPPPGVDEKVVGPPTKKTHTLVASTETGTVTTIPLTTSTSLHTSNPEKMIIKVPKKKTLKRPPKKDHLNIFKQEGLSALKMMTERELSKLIRHANTAYYCDQTPIMTDNEYDILREYTASAYPKNKAVLEGHTKCKMEIVKNKVKLPYEMWSMDKIKPDTGALDKWKMKYSGPYVLSCKLDGVSGLYSTEGETPALYTRGNGKIGQDISHLIPFLTLPQEKGIVIRGEFIVPKAVFAEKYAAKFANPRNYVAGLINQKKIDPSVYKDLDFVAYEVIQPEMSPGEQMNYLTTLDVEVVRNVVETDVTNEMLSELLVAWRDDYKYEIDGVICIDDKIYPRETGNPDHAFAFKMVLSDQIAEAKVLDVIWTPSKDGYLKPRVQIDPVVLGGAKIEYATGFNGKFIEDNKIGVGALIKLIRSGDVIPHIVSVIQPAAQTLMPSVPYVWNETHVDIMLKDKSQDSTVKEKTIAGFFKVLDVDGLGPGNVKRLIKGGFDTVPKIIEMNKDDFLTVDGFKEKSAEKLYRGIKNKVEKASLPELMQASNIFGRGFGKRRFTAILAQEPDILMSEKTDAEKIAALTAIEGMAKKSAEKFLSHIAAFVTWAKSAGLESRLIYKVDPTPGDTEHELYGKKWVMTGFRDKELIEKLEKVGAIQQSAVSKKTFMVIVKDKDEDTGKAEEARRLGVQVLTPEEIIEKYKL